VVDLPYRFLQKASLHFFGITIFAIKLPSLLIGLFAGLGLLWLLRSWLLRSNIALFASIIAVTSSQFLLVASSGTPLVMPVFWAVALLLLALKLSANHTSLIWSLCAGVALGLSLYTPLSLFLILSLPLAVVLHPRLRHLLRTIPKKNIAMALVIFAIMIVPLSIALFKSPSLFATLLGWPGSSHSLGQIKLNLIELAKSYLLFWYPQLTTMGLTPIFGLGPFCLMILGALKLLVDHHSARSYSLALLLPILLIPVVLQPQYAVIFFVPFILLLAIGIEALLDEWYKLFPHNPYARVVALVPLLILLTGIIISNTSRYTSVMRYSSTLPLHYSQDLSLTRSTIRQHPGSILVTSSQELPFYDLLRRDFSTLNVTDQLPPLIKNKHVIISHSNPAASNTLGVPSQIITDSYKDHGPRFYVFIGR
jgi:4-amino-4-deoxy-L-arabinose transferase-like glycosyltransferase